MGGPYHGRLKLRWCHGCNVPVLGKFCSICSTKTEEVAISPPGDVRPTFEADVRQINMCTLAQYGAELIMGERVVVLNKTSGVDRFDEVIMDGRVQGVLEYNPEKGYNFLPRLEGAKRLWLASCSKNIVEIDPTAVPYILKGASVLMPGVTRFDENIKEGDQVIIVSDGHVVGVGRSRFSGKVAKEMEKGMFVKVRRSGGLGSPMVLAEGADWSQVVKANSEVLKKYEEEAMVFIRQFKDSDCAVAISGGKDSLVTLLLVQKALGNVPVMFIDTGIEFDETIDHIKCFARSQDLDILVEKGGDFFKGVEYFGPPGRDYRWCCKVCKLGPTAKLIHRYFPDGVVNFIGQRGYESETRAKSGRIWKNPWLPKQTGAGPIQHWTALHVWLYLFKEEVEYNPLYEQGLERIGCWPCPAIEMSEAEVVNEIHPDSWQKWAGVLKAQGFSEDDFSLGAWRWRTPPKGKGAAKRHKKKEFQYNITGDKVHGTVEMDFEKASVMARTLGAVITDGMVKINGITVDRNGHFEFPGGPEGETIKRLKVVFGLVERSKNCFGCGVCVGQCPERAIDIDKEKMKIDERCVSCGACHERCPIIKYGVERAIFKEIN